MRSNPISLPLSLFLSSVNSSACCRQTWRHLRVPCKPLTKYSPLSLRYLSPCILMIFTCAQTMHTLLAHTSPLTAHPLYKHLALQAAVPVCYMHGLCTLALHHNLPVPVPVPVLRVPILLLYIPAQHRSTPHSGMRRIRAIRAPPPSAPSNSTHAPHHAILVYFLSPLLAST